MSCGDRDYDGPMPAIRRAQTVALYLFDVAETVNLDRIPALIGGSAVAARLTPKPPTPAYMQYEKAPLTFDGDAIGAANVDGFVARFRVYDYGVVSVALARPFEGEWMDLVAAGQQLMESAELEQRSEQLCRQVLARIGPALLEPRREFLSEDYLVYALHELDEPLSGDELLARYGEQLAAMLRGERQPLSEQEKAAVLQHRLSYLADDLIIATWNAAVVYDTVPGVQAALDILEFANSQLLQTATTTGSSMTSSRRSTRGCSTPAGTSSGSTRAMRGRRGRSTRCSSTSTSSPTAPRTR